MQVDEHNELISLFDTYGELLSEKQFYVTKKILELDLGESELAEVCGETRQSVHDAVVKAKKQLAEFEEKCKFVELKKELREELLELTSNIDAKNFDKAKKNIQKILNKL